MISKPAIEIIRQVEEGLRNADVEDWELFSKNIIYASKYLGLLIEKRERWEKDGRITKKQAEELKETIRKLRREIDECISVHIVSRSETERKE